MISIMRDKQTTLEQHSLVAKNTANFPVYIDTNSLTLLAKEIHAMLEERKPEIVYYSANLVQGWRGFNSNEIATVLEHLGTPIVLLEKTEESMSYKSDYNLISIVKQKLILYQKDNVQLGIGKSYLMLQLIVGQPMMNPSKI